MRAAHAEQAEIVAARAEGTEVDPDEAEEVMARFEWMNSVSSAPALSVPAQALAAGSRQAPRLAGDRRALV